MLTLTTDYMRGQLARAIPGAVYEQGAWQWDASTASPRDAAIALRLFPELAVSAPALLALRASAVDTVRPIQASHDRRAHAPRVVRASGLTPHAFQCEDVGYVTGVLEQHGAAYIGWEMGLGKTLATCMVIDDWRANYVLVVCPNAAKRSVWEPALREWCPWLRVVVMGNTAAQRKRAILETHAYALNATPFVLVVHYEALPLIAGRQKQRRSEKGWVDCEADWEPGDPLFDKTRTALGTGWNRFGTWDLVVADEAHRLKNPDAQWTKVIKKIPSVGRLALSGSVLENSLEELWSPLQWLYPKQYSARWRTWNDRFIDYVDGPFGQVCVGPRVSALPKLREELGQFMVYRRASDELDIPVPHDRDLLVDLSPAQRRVYDQLVADLRADLDDGRVLRVAEGLPLLSKLRQVATGLDLLGNVTDSTKLDLAEELIKDNPDSVFVVFGWYRASLNALADRLGHERVHVVHGGVTQSARDRAITDFRAGDRRVLLATLSTLSEAVNLQNAGHVILLDHDWNPERVRQAIGRVVRQGQTKHVAVSRIIARDTVDQLNVLPTIISKENLRALVLGG